MFKLGFKTSSSSFSMDLLVMENLFFNRDITETFDLKGSIRNRLAKSQLVLMDENLIKVSCERPLYVTPEARQNLLAKLERDTAFLCGQAMMDYSLLVGLEKDTGELVRNFEMCFVCGPRIYFLSFREGQRFGSKQCVAMIGVVCGAALVGAKGKGNILEKTLEASYCPFCTIFSAALLTADTFLSAIFFRQREE